MQVHNDAEYLSLPNNDGGYVLVSVQSYDESIDTFSLRAVGFTEEDEENFPIYAKSAPDFDDFEVPGIVLPALLGEGGDPSELIDKVFAVKLP